MERLLPATRPGRDYTARAPAGRRTKSNPSTASPLINIGKPAGNGTGANDTPLKFVSAGA